MSCKKIEKFKIEDWYEIEPRKELEAGVNLLRTEPFWKDVYTKGMPFFTYRDEEGIIMIYGLMSAGCGTYMPAVIASVHMKKHIRTVINLLQDYYATYTARDVRRLEAYCDILDSKAIRLARFFGFSVIGIRHNSSPEGHDQAILERLVNVDPRKVGR